MITIGGSSPEDTAQQTNHTADWVAALIAVTHIFASQVSHCALSCMLQHVNSGKGKLIWQMATAFYTYVLQDSQLSRCTHPP